MEERRESSRVLLIEYDAGHPAPGKFEQRQQIAKGYLSPRRLPGYESTVLYDPRHPAFEPFGAARHDEGPSLKEAAAEVVEKCPEGKVLLFVAAAGDSAEAREAKQKGKRVGKVGADVRCVRCLTEVSSARGYSHCPDCGFVTCFSCSRHKALDKPTCHPPPPEDLPKGPPPAPGFEFPRLPQKKTNKIVAHRFVGASDTLLRTARVIGRPPTEAGLLLPVKACEVPDAVGAAAELLQLGRGKDPTAPKKAPQRFFSACFLCSRHKALDKPTCHPPPPEDLPKGPPPAPGFEFPRLPQKKTNKIVAHRFVGASDTLLRAARVIGRPPTEAGLLLPVKACEVPDAVGAAAELLQLGRGKGPNSAEEASMALKALVAQALLGGTPEDAGPPLGRKWVQRGDIALANESDGLKTLARGDEVAWVDRADGSGALRTGTVRDVHSDDSYGVFLHYDDRGKRLTRLVHQPSEDDRVQVIRASQLLRLSRPEVAAIRDQQAALEAELMDVTAKCLALIDACAHSVRPLLFRIKGSQTRSFSCHTAQCNWCGKVLVVNSQDVTLADPAAAGNEPTDSQDLSVQPLFSTTRLRNTTRSAGEPTDPLDDTQVSSRLKTPEILSKKYSDSVAAGAAGPAGGRAGDQRAGVSFKRVYHRSVYDDVGEGLLRARDSFAEFRLRVNPHLLHGIKRPDGHGWTRKVVLLLPELQVLCRRGFLHVADYRLLAAFRAGANDFARFERLWLDCTLTSHWMAPAHEPQMLYGPCLFLPGAEPLQNVDAAIAFRRQLRFEDESRRVEASRHTRDRNPRSSHEAT
ncbi:hypothetical protein DIPPA_14855 [Diplonema papillatum]|nr:hypothetical protein DIPPA_14855 [Diplonema papillatum]